MCICAMNIHVQNVCMSHLQLYVYVIADESEIMPGYVVYVGAVGFSTTYVFFEVTGYNVSSTSNMSVSRLEISISCLLHDTPLPMCGEISATIRIVINVCTGQNIFCPETASIHSYDPECVVTDKAFNTTV